MSIIKNEEIVYGRQTVKEALLAGNVRKIYLLSGHKGSFVTEIKVLAQKMKAPVSEVKAEMFSEMVQNSFAAGGVAASVNPFIYKDIDAVLNSAKQSKCPANSLILILDHIEDPHNLGALLRTAEAAGAKGVVIPSRRAAKVTATVRKVSSGAAEWVPVIQVPNIVQTIQFLKNKGFWIYGAEMEGGLSYNLADWNRSIALVLGSEGGGLSDLVRKNCDLVINIPMNGKLNSLNVSVAGGILMFEHLRNKP